MSHRPADRARAAHTDMTIVATLIDDALQALDQSLAGWPTSTPGAAPAGPQTVVPCPVDECPQMRPCSVHDDDKDRRAFQPDAFGHEPAEVDTPVERNGLTPDAAHRDLVMLKALLKTIARQAAIAARITSRWGLAGIDATSVGTRLADIDAAVWCDNCGRYGFKNPRRKGGTECDFCCSFRQTYAPYPAPRELLDIHSSGRKVSINDITRIMDRCHAGWRRKIKKRAKTL